MFVLILLVICVATLYILYIRKNSIWSRQHIPISHYSFFRTVSIPFFQLDSELVEKYGKVVGSMIFFQPTLLVADIELTKKILNDLDNFPNRIKFGAERNVSGENMLFARDSKWKRLRQIVTPAFSPIKIRRMQHQIIDSVNDLINAFESTSNIVDVKPYFSGFTIDTIASCAFGIKLNSVKDPKNDFVRYGQKFFGSVSLRTVIVLMFPTLATEVLNLHGFHKAAADFFFNLTKQIIRTRRESSTENEYNDFIDLLMKAEYKGQLLTDKQIADQGIAFFLAGFDTSSVTLTTVSYLLGKYQDVQNRLFSEIVNFFRNNEEISYESINELEYLDAVINETLRHSPTLPRIIKEAAKDCVIRYKDQDIFIPKGAHINMSVYCMHRDEENFERANEFLPERFLKNSELRHNSQAFVPFGIGPRNCVGMRFALFEIKLCLVHLIRQFQFEIVPETEPIKYAPFMPVSFSETMYLKLIKR